MSTTTAAAETEAVTKTALPETDTLKFVSSGKVRDLYEIRDGLDEYLLFVATDRISAYDVVLKNGVPGKGALLTRISAFWFERLYQRLAMPHHVVARTLDEMPVGVRVQVEPIWLTHGLGDRTLLVRKAKVVMLEAIVRGYLTGSGWAEYKQRGTVHGITMPAGLIESAKLDEPLFTPSTKAEQGTHDENISPEYARELVGAELYDLIAHTAIVLFKDASAYALERGLILADTKFEFGLIPTSSLSSLSSTSTSIATTITLANTPYTLHLIDEALTPDSSRYWSLADYAPGRPQASFDKQFLRDWLVSAGFRKGLERGPSSSAAEGEEEGWSMTPEVVEGTRKRYQEVVKRLME